MASLRLTDPGSASSFARDPTLLGTGGGGGDKTQPSGVPLQTSTLAARWRVSRFTSYLPTRGQCATQACEVGRLTVSRNRPGA
jgi:hypothetical protein